MQRIAQTRDLTAATARAYPGPAFAMPSCMSSSRSRASRCACSNASRGESDSAQRDIYGLGVILYECLARRRPFVARSDAELIYRITTEEPCGIPLDPTTVTLVRCAEMASRSGPRPIDELRKICRGQE